jgi:Family of unknown function (DUF6868)
MITIDTLTVFFGWCSAINIGMFVFAAIILMILKEPISKLHSKLFGLNQGSLPLIYFRYLGNYKIAILMFNIVPYIALKVMI